MVNGKNEKVADFFRGLVSLGFALEPAQTPS